MDATKLKPFDLEAAKRGEPVITRDGRAVLELHHFTADKYDFPVCAILDRNKEDGSEWYSIDGRYYKNSESESDLFMAPKKRTVFVQIFDKRGDTTVPTLKAIAYENQQDAEQDAEHNVITTLWRVLIPAFPVKIEE